MSAVPLSASRWMRGEREVASKLTSLLSLRRWVTAIRLAGYESSRLMEIYTGHL